MMLTYLARKLDKDVMLVAAASADPLPSTLMESARVQEPSAVGSGDRQPWGRDQTGDPKETVVPEGMRTWSDGVPATGVVATASRFDDAVVGTPCCDTMASFRRQRTSSADARSMGVWPS